MFSGTTDAVVAEEAKKKWSQDFLHAAVTPSLTLYN